MSVEDMIRIASQLESAAIDDDSAFCSVAIDLLKSADYPTLGGSADVIDWIHAGHSIPAQISIECSPEAITIYRGQKVSACILVCSSDPPRIHTHAHASVAAVVEGQVLFCNYSFSRDKLLANNLATGVTEPRGVETLEVGSIRELRSDDLHSLWELASPSAILLITRCSQPTVVQYKTYWLSGLALGDPPEDESAAVVSQALILLYRLKDPRFLDRARRLLSESDPSTAFAIMQALVQQIDSRTYGRILASPPRKHRELFRTLSDQQNYSKRVHAIAHMHRETICTPAGAALIAPLIACQSRRDIERVVGSAAHSRDVHAALLDWVAGILPLACPQLASIDAAERATVLDSIRPIIETPTLAEAYERLRAEFEEEHVPEVLRFWELLRENTLLAPLFG